MRASLLFVCFIILFVSCSDDSTNPITDPITDPNTKPDLFKHYTVKPPNGFLPYPNHNPKFDETKYSQIEKLQVIINNFALYQANDDGSYTYFHSGIDFVYPNGTKMYSLSNGKVVHIDQASEYYYLLIIQDTADPDFAWMYVHINNIQHKVGDVINVGDHICDVHFKGLEHLHLTRLHNPDKLSWTDLKNIPIVDPINHFKFTDNEPPVFGEQIYYLFNNSELSAVKSDGSISGKVDLVVGIRDGGEYAHMKDAIFPESSGWEGFGDRLAISKIEYSISQNGNTIMESKSIDFTKIEIVRSLVPVQLLYKHWVKFEGNRDNWTKILSYYIITNNSGNSKIETSDADLCWDTTLKNSDGTAKFPNGQYVIKIKAWDSNGNMSEFSENVEVKNE